MKTERIVFDTNVLISAALDADSTPARARNHALQHGRLLGTEETLREFADTLLAPKFDQYVSRATRQVLLERLPQVIEIVVVIQMIRACRDPQDDKFLEAAVNGRADVIVTGDKDLLALNPFMSIEILTPTQYLARREGE